MAWTGGWGQKKSEGESFRISKVKVMDGAINAEMFKSLDMAEKRPLRSVVPPDANGDELLKNCLDSIRRVYGDRPQIVVVDNANQRTCAELAKAYPNVTYVAAP